MEHNISNNLACWVRMPLDAWRYFSESSDTVLADCSISFDADSSVCFIRFKVTLSFCLNKSMEKLANVVIESRCMSCNIRRSSGGIWAGATEGGVHERTSSSEASPEK